MKNDKLPLCSDVPIIDTIYAKKQDPLKGGVSISTSTGCPGSLGVALSSKVNSRQLYALTAADVVRPKTKDPVYQPALRDSRNARAIGQFEDQMYSITLLKLWVQASVREIMGIDEPLRGYCKEQQFSVLRNGTRVKKSGRSTEITAGRLLRHNDNYAYVVPESPRKRISEKGDSGSLWFTLDYRAVGIHLGWHENKGALLSALWPVLEEWRLEI